MAINKLQNTFYRINLGHLVPKLWSKSFDEKPLTNLIINVKGIGYKQATGIGGRGYFWYTPPPWPKIFRKYPSPWRF